VCSVAVPLFYAFVALALIVGYWMYWPAIRGGFRGVTSADLWRTGLSRPKHLAAFCVLWLAAAIAGLLVYTHHC